MWSTRRLTVLYVVANSEEARFCFQLFTWEDPLHGDQERDYLYTHLLGTLVFGLPPYILFNPRAQSHLIYTPFWNKQTRQARRGLVAISQHLLGQQTMMFYLYDSSQFHLSTHQMDSRDMEDSLQPYVNSGFSGIVASPYVAVLHFWAQRESVWGAQHLRCSNHVQPMIEV